MLVTFRSPYKKMYGDLGEREVTRISRYLRFWKTPKKLTIRDVSYQVSFFALLQP
jgi:hypothetical protein